MLSDVPTRADLQVGSGLLYILISVEITPSVSSSSNIPAGRSALPVAEQDACCTRLKSVESLATLASRLGWKLYTRYDESVKVLREKKKKKKKKKRILHLPACR